MPQPPRRMGHARFGGYDRVAPRRPSRLRNVGISRSPPERPVVTRLHAFDCGWLSADLHLFLTGVSGRVRAPVPAYLIEHPRGLVLFDSGLHADARVDAEKRLGFLAKLFHVEFGAGETVGERLRALGHDPARVTHLVTSHLHFDHAGGHAEIPNA